MINNQTFFNVQESLFTIAKGAGSEATMDSREFVEIPLATFELMCEIILELVFLLLIGLGFLLLHFMTCLLFVGMVSSFVSGRSPRLVFRGLARAIRASLTRRRCSLTTQAVQTTDETLLDSRQGSDNPYYGSVHNVV